MNRNGCVISFYFFLHALSGTASAGPVLITSLDFHGGLGHAPESEQRVEFFFEITSADLDPPGIRLRQGTLWSEGDEGIQEFTADTNPSFASFTDMITNGVNDRFLQYSLWPDGMGGASGRFESGVFDRDLAAGDPPDLIGYRIDMLRLIVRDVDFEPWPFPQNNGFTVDYNLTLEFYGAVVPEPLTLVILLVAGIPVFLIRVALQE